MRLTAGGQGSSSQTPVDKPREASITETTKPSELVPLPAQDPEGLLPIDESDVRNAIGIPGGLNLPRLITYFRPLCLLLLLCPV